MLKLFKTLFIFLVSLSLNAQIAIEFKNPSFEGIPRNGRLKVNTYLSGWSDCAHIEFPEESSFDIQPGFFEVKLDPHHGISFVGLVTRANGTYESVGQVLNGFLLKDSTYQFSIYLAKSAEYKSGTKATAEAAKLKSSKMTKRELKKNPVEIELIPFTENTILRVWGGVDNFFKDELLFTSEEISHTNWKEYTIEFVAPSNNIKFITFEAYYPDDSIFTRGNLMIDYIVSSRKE